MTTTNKQYTYFSTIELGVAIKSDLPPHLMEAELDAKALEAQLTLINAGDRHEADVLDVYNVKIHEEEEWTKMQSSTYFAIDASIWIYLNFNK